METPFSIRSIEHISRFGFDYETDIERTWQHTGGVVEVGGVWVEMRPVWKKVWWVWGVVGVVVW